MRSWSRRGAFAGFGLVLAVVVSVMLDGDAAEDDTRAGAPTPAATTTPGGDLAEDELEVHFIDAGQGDATLLRSADATLLVDTGRHTTSDVVDYLHDVGVTTIDVVAVTHPHADHIGQFADVLGAFDVAEVWWSPTVHPTRTFERAVAALESSDAAVEEPAAGDRTELGGMVVEFANPGPESDPEELHDSGLVFRVSFGDVAFLFTGDSETHTEERVVADTPELLDADVYQAGHHGSRTSSSVALLEAVTPSVIVWSAAQDSQFGHPHAEALERMRATGADIYGTAVHGTVVVTTDGTSLAVTAERDVPPDGGES